MRNCNCFTVFASPNLTTPPPITPPVTDFGILTISGADMTVGVIGNPTGGMTYTNSNLAGYDLIVFANPFNRYLLSPTEYAVLPGGGFEIYTGNNYTFEDIFIVIPNGLLP
jgi:hypothetical protein